MELKKHKEGPDCILALCSELVRTSPTVHLPDGKTCTTVEYFRDVFLPLAGIPAERLVVIPVPDSMDDKAQFRAISLLLGKIEAEDTLSIDLSGGMRDTAMLLVTAARCMRDLRSVETRRVIYSNCFQMVLPASMTAVSCTACSTSSRQWTSSFPQVLHRS